MKILIDTLYKQAAVAVLFSGVVLGMLTFAMEPRLRAEWQDRQFAAVAASFQAEEVSPVDFGGISLTAKGAIVYDVEEGVALYTKNADTSLPLASVTKLFTALVASEDFKAHESLTIPAEALGTEGDSGLRTNDAWEVQDLLDYLLTVSSNDAATVFAVHEGGRTNFIQKVNQRARDLGLTTVRIYNESGLDESATRAGGYASPRDVARLLAYIVVTNSDLLARTTQESVVIVNNSGVQYAAINTNEITNLVPNLVGGKTGYTDLAGGNLAVVFNRDIGRPVVVVVLGSTKEERFTDVLKLVERVL